MTAILIAVVIVLGALVAWRASVADDSGGDADFAGLQIATRAEETRALNTVNAYEHYSAYTAYQRNTNLAALIDEDRLNETDEDLAALLDAQRANADDIAEANLSLFPNQYLNRDGTYGLQREMGELLADAAKQQDLNPEPMFAEADSFRTKANWLLGSTTILGIAVVFFTLIETVSGRAKYAMFAVATLIALAGTVLAVLIEYGIYVPAITSY